MLQGTTMKHLRTEIGLRLPVEFPGESEDVPLELHVDAVLCVLDAEAAQRLAACSGCGSSARRSDGKPFVHQRARIQIPWNLTMHDRACIGDRANIYSLGPVELGAECTVAQECYLCTGTHDFEKTMFLMTAKITIGARSFLGARAFIMPGVTIGEDCIIGACSVVTKDTPAGMICAGNPCRVIKPRFAEKPAQS